MNLHEQAQRYLDAIPPAVAGQKGHEQLFNAARALVWGFNLPETTALTMLHDYSNRCSPPWSESELEHKVKEANSKPYNKPRGYLISRSPKPGGKTVPAAVPPVTKQMATAPKAKAQDYDLSSADLKDIPPPIPNPLPLVLNHCFQEKECIRIMPGIMEDDAFGHDKNGGLVMPREDWLKKFENNRDINSYYTVTQAGIYIGLNPLKSRELGGGNRDKDVTSFRHCLLEFDKISIAEQWSLYQQSRLPIAAVIFSGGKSLHAWVKIHAKDREEYDSRVETVYDHFENYQPDRKNRNPARLSRCPGAMRGSVQQSLHALDIGAPSFAAWAKAQLVEGIGHTYSFNHIRTHNAETDGKNLIGNQWLRKGGSVTLVGPSGVGKSSLAIQMCVSWALGRAIFGIAPVSPLKILVVQAENDLCDLHRFIDGSIRGMVLTDNDFAILEKNLVINHCITHTGAKFIDALQRLIEQHEPVLVNIDPILSFMGDDISKQAVCSDFLRNQLNPIAEATGVAWFLSHHTGKPPAIQTYRGKRIPVEKTMSELSYLGMGSSELTNWSRAYMVLTDVGKDCFKLHLAKRGKQAEARDPDGNLTRVICLSHTPDFIYWMQTGDLPEPDEPLMDAPKTIEPKLSIAQQFACSNLHEFLNDCKEEGELRPAILARMEQYALDAMGICREQSTWKRALELCVENGKIAKKLTPAPNLATGRTTNLYFKGPNA